MAVGGQDGATSAWTPPLPVRLAAARQSPLVGRRLELEMLEGVWSQVTAGRRQLVFLGGEPGAGKTRLIAEAAGALQDHGVPVLVGTCGPDAGIPYQPFAEFLDHLFATAPAGSLAAAIGSHGEELLRLSSRVRRHRPDLGDGVSGAGEVRRDLFDAVASLLKALAAEVPLAVMIDDLQWAQLPTIAMLEHVVQACTEEPMLVVGAFRTTAPDRSDELAARMAELHRLEGVRRVDLSGLDTEAIAEYLSLRAGLPLSEARPPAALLRDRTGGNPFFLRELWADLERRGGVSALRSPGRVPSSISDTLAARLAALGEDVRAVIELAAVLGPTFDLATLVAASETEQARTLGLLDVAMAVGLIEADEQGGDGYSFVHALARQAVMDRMPPSRRTLLHARAAGALEHQPPHASLVPRLAHHYLASHILGFHHQALRYSREAGRLAERSLAFEDAAAWFERAAALPECEPATRSELLLAAAADYVRASHFPHAREIYERLYTIADPVTRLAAAIGFEDASWRPGLVGPRAADLLSLALAECGLDRRQPLYVRGLGSLARALALSGETARARQASARAAELAADLGEDASITHVLTTSMWHGTTPDVASEQMSRTTAVGQLARERRDYETLGAAANFLATVSYLVGRPDGLQEALDDARRAVGATGQPYYHHVYRCLAHAGALLQGDFETARHWADETVNQADTFGDEMTEGPHGVQMFMLARETGTLESFRPYLDGTETFAGRWVPGLLALYTELGLEAGIRRALRHLMGRELGSRSNEAQWPMELAFMTEAALAIGDAQAARTLRPLLAEYAGMNLVSGTMIALFGSCDRYLGRVAALLGEQSEAESCFETALEMDRRMGSVVHTGETLAHYAAFAAHAGRTGQAEQLAAQARQIAEPVSHVRVLRLIDAIPQQAGGPDGLTDRELEVMRLLAAGLSNQAIGHRLHISANTAANHIRSILMKTGAANRTQAAMYAAQHHI
ncbi:MAG TPA: AAA family ATPase, partial [Acidimicrobiales bacterium]|nr:AAA family ATPase [Acidimicrobiales bacterium]